MISHTAVLLAGAALATLFVSPADWASRARAWLRRQTLGRIGL